MALNEVKINHRYNNTQPDDGVHPSIAYTMPSDWNATELLSGSTGAPAEASLLTYAAASSTAAAFRALASDGTLTIVVTDGAITVTVTPFSFINGSGTPGRLAKFNTATNLTDSIIRDDGTTIGINGVSDTTVLLRLYAPVGKEGLLVNGAANQWAARVQADTTSGQSFGLQVRGGTTSADSALRVFDATGVTTYLRVDGAGSLTVGISGPHAIGGAIDTSIQLKLLGSFTSPSQAEAFRINSAITNTGNTNVFGIVNNATFTHTGAGAASIVANTYLVGSAITMTGGGSVTIGATLNISGPMSGAGTNYALRSESGVNLLVGQSAIGSVGSGAFFSIRGSWTGVSQTEMMRADTALTGVVGANIFGLIFVPAITEAASGTHGQITGIYVAPTFVNAAGTTTNVFGINIDTIATGAVVPTIAAALRIAVPTGGATNYAILADSGSVRISSSGPHSIGAALDANSQLFFSGTFTSGSTHAWGLQFGATLVPTANSLAAQLLISGTLNKAGSGTHATFAGIYVNAPLIGAGVAALTDAASLYIVGAPVGATNNYAIFVVGGSVRIGSAGPHVFGGGLSTAVGIYFSGTFSSSAAFSRGIQIDQVLTAGADAGNIVGLFINPTLTERGAGTHPILAGVYVNPTVSSGAASTTDLACIYVDTVVAATGTTNATGIKIAAVPSGATNNYALWAVAGSVRIDNYIQTTAPNVRTTTTYTVVATDNYIISDQAATLTLTLPTASANTGRALWVQTRQAFTVISNASNVVPKTGGAAGTAILAATAGVCALLVSDGTNWIIVASGT